MSQPTRWSVVCACLACACLLLAFACATGGENGGGGNTDDASTQPLDAPVQPRMDGNTSTLPDAPKDASLPPPTDAFNPPPMDAPSGPFCMSNSQCTVAGECCISINGVGFCGPGTVIAGVCFPI